MFGGGASAQMPGTSEDGHNLGVQVIPWYFIVVEIGEDKGILGNDFSMAYRITVRPQEAAVYLSASSGGGRDDMGERLSIAEVRAITEEAYELWRG